MQQVGQPNYGRKKRTRAKARVQLESPYESHCASGARKSAGTSIEARSANSLKARRRTTGTPRLRQLCSACGFRANRSDTARAPMASIRVLC